MSDFRPQPGFRRRLGYYLVGLAIGFAMLGMIWWAKSTMTRGNHPAQPPQPSPTTAP